jgi:hypothetical protein
LRQDDALRARGGESIIGVSLSLADGFSTCGLTIMQISNRLILGVVAATLPLTAPAQSTKPTMKAIVVHQYGDPEVLKYEDVPRRASEGKQAR